MFENNYYTNLLFLSIWFQFFLYVLVIVLRISKYHIYYVILIIIIHKCENLKKNCGNEINHIKNLCGSTNSQGRNCLLLLQDMFLAHTLIYFKKYVSLVILKSLYDRTYFHNYIIKIIINFLLFITLYV